MVTYTEIIRGIQQATKGLEMCFQCDSGIPHMCAASGGAIVGNPSQGYSRDDARQSFGREAGRYSTLDEEIPLRPNDQTLTPRNTRGAGISLETHIPSRTQPRDTSEVEIST